MKADDEINFGGDKRNVNARRTLRRISRRLDAIALEHLRVQAARLAVENDQLRDQLCSAEQNVEFWHCEATEMHLQLCERDSRAAGIARDGRLAVVSKEG